jgi:putative transposase
VLKEYAAGLSAADVSRKQGISDATFYKWRSRFGGMEISDARKLKALEERVHPSVIDVRATELVRHHSAAAMIFHSKFVCP